MQEIGLDISGQKSKSVMGYLGRVHMGTVITVCSHAEERYPLPLQHRTAVLAV